MPAHDYTPFFPSDYRGDPGVAELSLPARAIWTELFIYMMMTKPYGHLMHRGSGVREGDFEAIAHIARCDVRDVRRHMPEVKASGVYSVLDDGTIFSRKLVALAHRHTIKSRAGKIGGEASARLRAEAFAQADLLDDSLSTSAQAQSNPIQSKTNPDQISSSARAQESDALGFGRWFLAGAIAAGCVPPDRAIDSTAWALKQLDDAEALLSTYGLDACKAKALALFAAKRAKKIRARHCDIRWLREYWNLRELDENGSGKGVSESTKRYLESIGEAVRE